MFISGRFAGSPVCGDWSFRGLLVLALYVGLCLSLVGTLVGLLVALFLGIGC